MSDPLDHLPEHLKHRRTGEAVMAPSAILGGAAVASVGILAGIALLPALAIGGVVYGGIVALRLPRKPKGPRIDPRQLPSPWREFVVEALAAKGRYQQALATVAPGPLRDTLTSIGDRLDAGVQESWAIARRGAALDGAVAALDPAASARDRAEIDAAAWTDPAARERALASVVAREESAQRLSTVAADARDRLRVLDAKLDEAVARAIELSLRADDRALSGLGGDVESLVSEMESLRQALDETAGTTHLPPPTLGTA